MGGPGGGKGEVNHRSKTTGNGGKGGAKKVRFNATTWACKRCQGTAQSWGAYNWWHRKECYECGAPRPAKDPGDEVPREKPGAIAPWENNTKELENLKLRSEIRRIQEHLDNLRNPPQAEDVPLALSDTEEAGIDDEDEEPLSADKEINKLRARRNTLQNDLAGIKKASVSS